MSFGHRRAPDISDELRERHGEHRDPVGSLAGRVPRFGHGSRVPGWDDAVDLSKAPAVIPDPANTPVPEDLRREIETAMAKYPDRRSAAIPALHAAQARPRLVLARGDHAGGRGHAPHARLPDVGGELLRHVRAAPQARQRRVRVHEHLLLDPRRRRVLRRDGPGRRGRGHRRALVRVPRRLRHRADGVGQRRVRRAARAGRRRADRRGPQCRAAGPARQAAALPPLGGSQRPG